MARDYVGYLIAAALVLALMFVARACSDERDGRIQIEERYAQLEERVRMIQQWDREACDIREKAVVRQCERRVALCEDECDVRLRACGGIARDELIQRLRALLE